MKQALNILYILIRKFQEGTENNTLEYLEE